MKQSTITKRKIDAEFIQAQLERTGLTKYGMAKNIGAYPNHFSQVGGKKSLNTQQKNLILLIPDKKS